MAKGRDKKSSKGRLDKYYHLAKEQGYRARSAFKLIQLNKKYNFLENSRVLIDLCAAPGGWLQVATKYMPQSSLIIGVDLAPIKPIPNVIAFQDDITTDRCRQHLRQELKTWKADVVLHDGAPNVGIAWAQDAYSQSELVLMSLKLAVEFLNKGGTFVTKVFRSKDYNKLLWVFQQMFRKVEATKPPSSRTVSAEIFVVCQDFIAPKKIDPRFLDAKAVFSEVDENLQGSSIDIFKPEKKKRQREGYEEGNYTLHKKADAVDFVKSQEPAVFLGTYNQIVFESDEAKALLNHELTTDEVKANFDDLKVLGKRDFKTLLKWRMAFRKEYKLEQKELVEVTEMEVEEKPLDEAEQVEMELAHLSKAEAARVKRERRKANEKKAKLIRRMQLNMITPTDIGMEEHRFTDQPLFHIASIKENKDLDNVLDGNMEAANNLVDEIESEYAASQTRRQRALDDLDERGASDSDLDDDLADQLDSQYQQFKRRMAEKDAKSKVKQVRDEADEWHGFDNKKQKISKKEKAANRDSDDDSSDEDNSSQEDSDDLGDTEDSDVDSMDEDEPTPTPAQRPSRPTKGNALLNDLGTRSALSKKTASGLSKGASMFFGQDVFKGVDLGDDDEEEDEEEDDDELGLSGAKEVVDSDQGSDFEIAAPQEFAPSDDDMWSGDEDEQSKKVKQARADGLNTAEAITLARQLANKQKTKSGLIDDGFSREGFRDKEGLPEWFCEDEGKHNRPIIPVTKEASQALREKLRALDARPIKKVAEAKARKKMKAAKRMQRAQKKATDIADNPDMSEREKALAIDKLIKRSTKVKPKREIKVVVAKGTNRGLKGRPQGVKGRYKMVDARMKKDLRALKRKEKQKKRR